MADKYCTKCGAKIPDGAKYCPECGTPVLPDDDNLMDATQIVDKQDTTDIPQFHQTEENTQEIPAQPQQNYSSQNQKTIPYDQYTDNDEEEYEEPEHHTGLMILIIIVVVLAVLTCILVFSGKLGSILPGHHDETAAETEATVTPAGKTQKKEKNEEADEDFYLEESPEPSATPSNSAQQTTNEDSEPASNTQKGTVFVSSGANGPQRIKVRTGPSLSATDTNERKYDGDSVTVYETKNAEGYTWYRIGDNQWIAGDGSTFGVNLN